MSRSSFVLAWLVLVVSPWANMVDGGSVGYTCKPVTSYARASSDEFVLHQMSPLGATRLEQIQQMVFAPSVESSTMPAQPVQGSSSILRDKPSKRMVVIGGGPAGFMAAIKAAQRCHPHGTEICEPIYLYEKYPNPIRARFLGLFSQERDFLTSIGLDVNQMTYFPAGKEDKRGILIPDLELALAAVAVKLGVRVCKGYSVTELVSVKCNSEICPTGKKFIYAVKPVFNHKLSPDLKSINCDDPRPFTHVFYATGKRQLNEKDFAQKYFKSDVMPIETFALRGLLFAKNKFQLATAEDSGEEIDSILNQLDVSIPDLERIRKQPFFDDNEVMLQLMSDAFKHTNEPWIGQEQTEQTELTEQTKQMVPVRAEVEYGEDLQDIDDTEYPEDKDVRVLPDEGTDLPKEEEEDEEEEQALGEEPPLGSETEEKMSVPVVVDDELYRGAFEDIKDFSALFASDHNEQTRFINRFRSVLRRDEVLEHTCFVSNLAPAVFYDYGVTEKNRALIAKAQQQVVPDYLFLTLGKGTAAKMEPRRIHWEGPLPGRLYEKFVEKFSAPKPELKERINKEVFELLRTYAIIDTLAHAVLDNIMSAESATVSPFHSLKIAKKKHIVSRMFRPTFIMTLSQDELMKENWAGLIGSKRSASIFAANFVASSTTYGTVPAPGEYEEQTFFIVGDAAQDAWYRFGLGVHDAYNSVWHAVNCMFESSSSACGDAMIDFRNHQALRALQIAHAVFAGQDAYENESGRHNYKQSAQRWFHEAGEILKLLLARERKELRFEKQQKMEASTVTPYASGTPTTTPLKVQAIAFN